MRRTATCSMQRASYEKRNAQQHERCGMRTAKCNIAKCESEMQMHNITRALRGAHCELQRICELRMHAHTHVHKKRAPIRTQTIRMHAKTYTGTQKCVHARTGKHTHARMHARKKPHACTHAWTHQKMHPLARRIKTPHTRTKKECNKNSGNLAHFFVSHWPVFGRNF